MTIDTVHFFVMTRNGKMASEGTFEPCEKETNDPAVQRSLCILFNVSSSNMPTFKINKSKKGLFYQEGIDKALSDVMEHHIVCRKLPKYNIE